jgi:hypothetical protein
MTKNSAIAVRNRVFRRIGFMSEFRLLFYSPCWRWPARIGTAINVGAVIVGLETSANVDEMAWHTVPPLSVIPQELVRGLNKL